jgi:hypothetical protein
VTRDASPRVVLLIDGSKVEDTKKFMVGGFRPYSLHQLQGRRGCSAIKAAARATTTSSMWSILW